LKPALLWPSQVYQVPGKEGQAPDVSHADFLAGILVAVPNHLLS
jgi:hypothetical protein